MARLRVDDVTKTFPARGRRPAVDALRSVRLDVPDGTTLAIVGPSGCGKTTLLRVIAGLERPDRGCVRFDDDDVTLMSPARRSVGFVFQSLALFEHLDVKANIGYGAGPYGVRRDERVRAAAARARVGDVLDAAPRRLSGGERQRVALARALAIEPNLLVLDEPFASLDAPLRGELRIEMARGRGAFGTTTLIVTHDRADAFALGDAIAVLEAGRIVQVATPNEILERPATSFVASFLAAGSLAAIDGTVVDGRFLSPGGIALEFPPACEAASARDAVRAGIRADRVRLADDGPVGGRIAMIDRDPTGATAHIDGAYGTLVARLQPEAALALAIGDDVRMCVEASGAHLFAADGRRVATL